MKHKELVEMSSEDRGKKLKDLRLELIKSQVNPSKSGGSKIKEIKKLIARILTINASKGGVENK